MTTSTSQSVTMDERLLAAVSHASVIFLGLGLIAPVVIWATQRTKSAYVAFQALQALTYQVIQAVLYFVVSLIGSIIMMAVVFGFFGLAAAFESEAMAIFAMLVQFLFLFGIFGVMGFYLLVGLIAAIFCLAGKSFRYPLIGGWLERFLQADTKSTVPEVTHAA